MAEANVVGPDARKGEPDANVPLYQHVKTELLAAIARNEYVRGEPFITQRELCARYQVSTTTAARALNELVMEGVLVRRRGQGTFVADQPVKPAPVRSAEGTIAYIGPSGWQQDGNGPHPAAIVAGVDSVCAELGFHLSITPSVDTPEDEHRAVRRALDAGVSGILLYPHEGRENADVLGEVVQRGVPLVMVDRYRPDLPTDAVIADNYEVGKQLTDHLVRLGHERIATLWGETDCTSVRDRLVGHLQSLREHGLPAHPRLTALRNYLDLPEEERIAYLRALLTGTEAPTALVCVNGGVLLTALHDMLKVDLALVGRVDLAGMDDQVPYNQVPFTKVAAVLPSREIGVEAMRLLADRISAPEVVDGPRHVVLPVRITTRQAVPAIPA